MQQQQVQQDNCKRYFFYQCSVVKRVNQGLTFFLLRLRKFERATSPMFQTKSINLKVQMILDVNKQTLALRQASEESACFHSSATIKTCKRIYLSQLKATKMAASKSVTVYTVTDLLAAIFVAFNCDIGCHNNPASNISSSEQWRKNVNLFSSSETTWKCYTNSSSENIKRPLGRKTYLHYFEIITRTCNNYDDKISSSTTVRILLHIPIRKQTTVYTRILIIHHTARRCWHSSQFSDFLR